MFADSGKAAERTVLGFGIQALAGKQCFAALERAHATQLGQLGVLLADWSGDHDANAAQTAMPMIAELVARAPDPVDAKTKDRFMEEFAAAPGKRKAAILQRRLRLEVARVLASDPAAVGTDVGFRELGMDSLISVELRNRLEKLLGLSLVSTIAFDYPNVDALTAYLLREHFTESAAAHAANSAASDQVVPDDAIPSKEMDDLLDISDEAAEELLLAELRDIRGAGSNE